MKTICPVCKGKGYKFNPEVFLMTFMAPFVMFLEHDDDPNDDPRIMSKKICKRCKGKGKIKL